MNNKANSILEDVGAVIGYQATATLVDWFGGRKLHIPVKVTDEHAICCMIGKAKFVHLVAEWGGQILQLPLDYQRERDRRDRMIVAMLGRGMTVREVANVSKMTDNHIRQTWDRLETMGVLPYLLRKAGVKSRVRKIGVKKPGATRVVKPALNN